MRRRAVVLALILGMAPAAIPGGTDEAGAPSAATVEELVARADEAYAREDWPAARALYQEAVGAGAAAARPLWRLARLQSWDGDLRAAVANFRRAREAAPADLDLALEFARVLTWKNELNEAARLHRELAAAHPDDARILFALAETLGWDGRYGEADAIYRDLEARRIEPIRAHAGRARLLAWQGRLDAAEGFYRDALRADPRHLEARLGMAQVQHWQGYDRKAVQQADAIVLDHPDSREARDLQRDIRNALRPRAEAEGYRLSDSDSNRVDVVIAAHTFMGEPQTSVRIAFTAHDASARCTSNGVCDDLGLAEPFGVVAEARARTLGAGVRSRIIGPITFNARAAAVQEEGFDREARTVAVASGFLRWDVGPRLSLIGSGGREALLDTAELIDRGLRVDAAEGRFEYRFHPAFTLNCSGGAASYSDGNVRWNARAAVEWRLPVAHPWLAGTFEASYRTFHEDYDHGYFDPLRYDAELLTVAIWDRYLRDRLFWRIEGTIGRQDFTTAAGPGAEAGDDDTVQGIYASFGVGLGGRATIEAYYWRSDYALQVATGFTASRTGIAGRFRF